MIIQNIKLALVSLRLNLLRSLLTTLGVIIGVAAVISLISIGQGVKNDVTNQIEGIGTNILAVIPGRLEAGMNSPFSMIALPNLTLEDKEAIKKEITLVDKISGIVFINALAEAKEKKLSLTVLGGEPDLQIVNVYELIEGRLFSEQELANQNRVCFIGEKIKEEFFAAEDPIGHKIKLNGQDFEIVGIIKGKALSQLGVDIDSIVAIPINSAIALSKTDKLARIMVEVKNEKDIALVKSEIKKLLLERHKGNEDFSIVTLDEIIGIFDRVIEILTLMISGIAAISLLVGGIGIMNIMLVSVAERTREIGLRKALGATNRAILIQFLTEAIIISLLGGLIGLFLSLVALTLIKKYTILDPAITWQAVVLAIGASGLIGLIFGVAPAIRASRKNPIDALRYE